MRVAGHKLKPSLLIDFAGGDKHIVRPQRYAMVAHAPGEADTLGDQATADSGAACRRFDNQ